MSKVILGVQLSNRIDIATKVQEVLTKHGCIIKTRLGLHSASASDCSNKGIIILEIVDDAWMEAKELEGKLAEIEGVEVKRMEF
jgi:hypothetical protein